MAPRRVDTEVTVLEPADLGLAIDDNTLELPTGPGIIAVRLDAASAIAQFDKLSPPPGAIVVGVAERLPPDIPQLCDVLVTDTPDAPRPWVQRDSTDDAVAEITATIQRSPAAAMALTHVLRMTESLPVADALTVESMAYSTLQHSYVFQSWLRERGPQTARPGGAEAVGLYRQDRELDIVLQRPEAHNALDAGMRDALCDAFDLVYQDAAITEVHLRGDGPSFCSGGDLAEFGTATDAGDAHLVRIARSVARRVHRCADRVTVHLHGACIGAGIEISAFAGHVVADPATTIQLPEVAMGLIPGAGGTASIPRRIGRQRAAYLALLGQPLDATTAARWGLVDDIAAPQPNAT